MLNHKKTAIGNLIDFRSKLDRLFYVFEGVADDYATQVVGRHILNHYNLKYMSEILNYDEIHYHCKKTHTFQNVQYSSKKESCQSSNKNEKR